MHRVLIIIIFIFFNIVQTHALFLYIYISIKGKKIRHLLVMDCLSNPHNLPFCSISLISDSLKFLTSRQTVIISETGCKTKAYSACIVPIFISATCKAVLCHWCDSGKPERITSAFEILFLKSFVMLELLLLWQ